MTAETVHETPEQRAQARAKGLFAAQSVGVRAFVVAAGPLANFLFAIVVFAALLMTFGRDATSIDSLSPRVDSVQAGSPAAQAGIQAGDTVLAVGDRMIGSFGELQSLISTQPGVPLRLVVERGGQRLSLVATPEAREAMDESGARVTRGVLGIGRTTLASERRIERVGPLEALGLGAAQTWKIVATTGAYIGNIFSGKASAEHIAGPLGIMDMSGQVAKGAGAAESFSAQLTNLIGSLLGWAATLSVAMGIANLLPIPVLDGGHLLFYGIEAARGRPLDPRAQNLGFRAGLAVLGSLFLFATWNDLQRLNVLEFLRGILS
jgi:regulator of sigma E protease